MQSSDVSLVVSLSKFLNKSQVVDDLKHHGAHMTSLECSIP